MPSTFQALQVLIFLLPGFVTAALVNFLFVGRKKTELDKVIQALFYSFVNYSIFALVFGRYPGIQPLSVAKQTSNGIEVYSLSYSGVGFLSVLAISVLVGLFVSFLNTHDLLTGLLRLKWPRKIKWLRRVKLLPITTRTSRSSVWSDVFHDKGRLAYVIVNLVDGERIMGWPLYYSDTPEEDSIFLSDAYWIQKDYKKIKIPGPGILVTSNARIESVEFLWPEEGPNEEHSDAEEKEIHNDKKGRIQPET